MWTSICNVAVFIALLAACTSLFVLHSLYFIFRYAENSSKTEIKYILSEQLEVPALVICNQMPFSQDGINSVNQNIRQDSSIRYLLEWTNPSIREDATFFAPPLSFYQRGADILASLIPSSGRNSTISKMQYDCQSVISMCSFQGVQLSSYDCCKNLISTSLVGPLGICWLLHDRSMIQNSTSLDKEFVVLFQIPRNSWYAPYMTVHPGIDIYLVDGRVDLSNIQQYLANPIRLRDKTGVRLKMHKESRAFTRRPSCGQELGDARRADRRHINNNNTALLICHLAISVKYCGCHPVMGDLLAYNQLQFSEFYRLMDRSNVCGVEQYESCSRRYIDLARGDQVDIPENIMGYEDLKKCQEDNPRRCVMTSYPGTLETFNLPSDYQNNQDFVARLSLVYDTMRVTEVLETKDPSLYDMLSFIGYNIACWFSIGHILWSLYRFGIASCHGPKNSNKVAPAEILEETVEDRP